MLHVDGLSWRLYLNKCNRRHMLSFYTNFQTFLANRLACTLQGHVSSTSQRTLYYFAREFGTWKETEHLIVYSHNCSMSFRLLSKINQTCGHFSTHSLPNTFASNWKLCIIDFTIIVAVHKSSVKESSYVICSSSTFSSLDCWLS